jgi:hypothetical protein
MRYMRYRPFFALLHPKIASFCLFITVINAVLALSYCEIVVLGLFITVINQADAITGPARRERSAGYPPTFFRAERRMEAATRLTEALPHPPPRALPLTHAYYHKSRAKRGQ